MHSGAEERVKVRNRFRCFKPGDPAIPVAMRVVVLGITNINMLEQTFDAELQLELTWEDPEFVQQTMTPDWQKGREEEDWQEMMRKTCWHPGLECTNCAAMHHVESWFHVESDDQVSFRCRLRGTFRERFELHDFPFDYQFLTVRFRSSFATKHCVFAKPKTDLCKRMKADFLQMYGFILEEWDLMPHLCVRSNPSSKDTSTSGTQYSEIKVECVLQRHSSYYLWNIIFIDLMLVCTSFSVLLVPPSEFADRMSISLTLLLTAVAFKYVVSEKLPSISYLTLLDSYVLCGFGMQVLVVLENSVALVWDETGEGGRTGIPFDAVGSVALATYLVVYHAYFALKAMLALRRRARAIEEYQSLQKERAENEPLHWHRVHNQDKPIAASKKAGEHDTGARPRRYTFLM